MPEHATMFYARNESLMCKVWGELIWADRGGCVVSTIVCDVRMWQVHDAGQSWQGTGVVHTDRSEWTWMHMLGGKH